MGYVTQTRDYGPVYWAVTSPGNAPRDVTHGSTIYSQKPPFCHEVTTSFRTGNSMTGDSVDAEDHVLDAHGGRLGGSFKFASSARTDAGRGKFDTGHTFSTSKTLITTSHPRHEGTNGRYGPLLALFASVNHLMTDFSWVPQEPSLVSRGTTAIRDTQPTRNPAGLAQALIELKREGLPSFTKAIQYMRAGGPANVVRGTSNAHLTTQFGIRPLIRDFEDSVKVIARGQEILKKFEEGAGKKQHRRRDFEPRVFTKTWDTRTQGDPSLGYMRAIANLAGGTPASKGLQSFGGTSSQTTWTYRSHDWFTGAYIYYLPDYWSDGIRGALAQYQYLAGMDFNKSLLWEVTPWSWLVDWWSNTGDYISNVQSLGSDGLVLLYGYMMRTVERTCVRTIHGIRSSNGTPLGPITTRWSNVTKERARATPYGFGLDLTGLSARQWSILGALGLTRGNNSLR